MLKHIGGSGSGSSAASHPGPVPGRWYMPYGTVAGTGAQVTNTLYAVPLAIHRRTPIAKLGVRVSPTGVVGTSVKMAIARNGADALPGEVITSTAAVSAAVAGSSPDVVPSPLVTLDPNTYWILALHDGASQVWTVALTSETISAMLGGSILQNAAIGLSTARTYGDGFPPTLTGFTWVENNAPTQVRYQAG